MITMQCGGCSGNVQVSEVQLKTQDVAPCTNCPAGVDLIHARAHSN